MRWMNLHDYPSQEPLSEAGAAYATECWRRSAEIPCPGVRLRRRSVPATARVRGAAPRRARPRVLAWRRLDVGAQGMDGLHGAGLHCGGRHVRIGRISARPAARNSRRRSTIAFKRPGGSRKTSRGTAASASGFSSEATPRAAIMRRFLRRTVTGPKQRGCRMTWCADACRCPAYLNSERDQA